MSHKKFGPDRFIRFDVYWIQTNKQTNRQTDKPNLYIEDVCKFLIGFFGFFNFNNLKLFKSNFLLVIDLGNKQHPQGKPMFNRIELLIFFIHFFSRNSMMAILCINVWYSTVMKSTSNPEKN